MAKLNNVQTLTLQQVLILFKFYCHAQEQGYFPKNGISLLV